MSRKNNIEILETWEDPSYNCSSNPVRISYVIVVFFVV